MIAAISPTDEAYEETLSTLKFVERAKLIEQTAVVNEDVTDSLVKQLRLEIEVSYASLCLLFVKAITLCDNSYSFQISLNQRIPYPLCYYTRY